VIALLPFLRLPWRRKRPIPRPVRVVELPRDVGEGEDTREPVLALVAPLRRCWNCGCPGTGFCATDCLPHPEPMQLFGCKPTAMPATVPSPIVPSRAAS
jgi:hypothetical protein